MTIIATKQATQAKAGTKAFPLVLLDNLKPTEFTIANTNKKPTLPAVDILSNSNVLTIKYLTK